MVANSTNTVDQAFLNVYQDITDVRRKLAAQGEQVQRIQRTVRLDEKEFAVGNLQSQRSVLMEVSGLAHAVSALVGQNSDPVAEAEAQSTSYYHQTKAMRQAEVRHNLNEIRLLARCKIVKLDVPCPCGKHHGLCFTDSKGAIIEDNMCPKTWWIKQSRLAFENHSLGQFVNSTPMSAYLEAYTILTKGLT
jgi:hypothetical protein